MHARREPLIALALFVMTLLVYWQTIDFGFIHYDDHRYVTQNLHVLRGLTIDNIQWAFTTFDVANWHPLTWLSHMLDVQLGLSAGGMHIENALLHGLNAVLLFVLLQRMTGTLCRSALAAGLFAWHPLHAESVAWISERKDVLSTFFGLLAMLAYARYAHTKDAGQSASQPHRPRRWLTVYALVIVCFACSLMCKPMLVTLPFVLLLLDWWPLQRVRGRRDWIRLSIEKTPLLALSVASCIITVLAQRAGGAVRDFHHVSLAQRLANAIMACGEYLWQTIWPTKLAVFYPYPPAWETWHIALAFTALVAITTACLVASRRDNRGPLAGWLWFLGTLVPVIGLVQVGAQSHADRYTYVPLVGVFIMFAWSLPPSPPLARRISVLIASCILVALAGIGWVQVGYWRDSITLAQHALDVTDNNAVAHVILGNALVDERDFDNAIAHLEIATRIDPVDPQAWHNLGFASAQAGHMDDAIAAYRQAIARRPDFAENFYNLGLLLQQKNRLEEALVALQRAAELAAAAGDETLRKRALERVEEVKK